MFEVFARMVEKVAVCNAGAVRVRSCFVTCFDLRSSYVWGIRFAAGCRYDARRSVCSQVALQGEDGIVFVVLLHKGLRML